MTGTVRLRYELRTHPRDEIKDALVDLGYLAYVDIGPTLALVWQESDL